MGTVVDACRQDCDELEAKAIKALNRAADDLANWVELIRDPEMPWAFRWAPESVRGANVAATNYIVGTAKNWGLIDRVLSAEQKEGGVEWIRSLEEPENVFSDPALLDRKPPAWPQKADTDVLDWIKKVEPNWSWIGRIIHRLMIWYHEGAIPRELLVECMDYAHSRQDEETGFWANGIQTSFKLLVAVHDPAELPVPHAEKLIDSVLRVMDQPDYDQNLFPCFALICWALPTACRSRASGVSATPTTPRPTSRSARCC